MLDVHVPQKSEHTWTDFFLHIATICVGLLIAIGLEQSVEYVHRARERSELREALYIESGQVVTDSRGILGLFEAQRLWINTRIKQLSTALADGRPVPPPPKFVPWGADRPNDPIWQAAKTSNSAALLSRNELAAYGELSSTCILGSKVLDDVHVAERGADAYARRFGGDMLTADLTHASRPEIQEMIERLANFDEALRLASRYTSLTEGAAEVIHGGERDVTKIYAAEKSANARTEGALAAQLASVETVPSSSSSHSAQ